MKNYVFKNLEEYFEANSHAAAVDAEIRTSVHSPLGTPASEDMIKDKGVWYAEELYRVAKEF